MSEKTMDQIAKVMEEKLKRLSEDIGNTADKGAEEIRIPDRKSYELLSCESE